MCNIQYIVSSVILQEMLLTAQEKRRNIGQHLTEIRSKSNDLQDQIHKVKRQENLQQFLELMRKETEVCTNCNYSNDRRANLSQIWQLFYHRFIGLKDNIYHIYMQPSICD